MRLNVKSLVGTLSIGASALFLILGFQNCSKNDFASTPLTESQKSSGEPDTLNEFQLGVSELYHWKCEFELRGSAGARWKVERYLKVDDDCVTARATVETNNPDATILSVNEVFLGYHSDDTANPYYWKCAFTLRGQNGFEWDVERFLKFDDDCVTARATVATNNPNATILSFKEVFLGYHSDATANPYHWKCAYTLRGQNGYRWDVERHLKFDDNCVTARSTVATNNPNATIVSEENIFMGYHQ